MYYWGVKFNKIMTEYSPVFDTKVQAYFWLDEFGINLKQMFDRDFVLCELELIE